MISDVSIIDTQHSQTYSLGNRDMKIWKSIHAALMLIALSFGLIACGGGGGDSGTGTPNSDAIKIPTLTASVQGGTNAVAVGGSTIQATLLDAKGQPVSNTLVQFTGDEKVIRFSPTTGAVLTNTSGIASIQVTSITSASVGGSTATTIKMSALVGTTTVPGSIDVSLTPVQTANLALALDVGSGSMNAYGNQAITATVTADGKALTDTPATVAFSASCGNIAPLSSQTNNAGIASTTYIADKLSCAGTTITISAAIEGSAKNTTRTITVTPALATNLLFTDATPKVIYLSGSTGATQSKVTFKVVDAQSNSLLNQSIKLSLTNAGPGVSFNTVGNTAPVTLTTDNNGQVSVPVFSGTVPTTAQVKAELAVNSNVYTNSNTLTVASGAPVQRALSLALETLSVEGFDIDGIETKVTLSMADRQGNPVPDGTAVNFTASSGVMIPATCYVSDGASRCTVTWRSSGTRPNNGKVAIFAQVIGEEDFTDTNGNNIFDANEVFTDLGNAYRDNNFSGTWDLGEFYVPRAGSSICAGGENGKTNTCDGKWGAADVRKQAILIAAKSKVDIAFNPTAPAIVPGAKDGDTQTPGGRITLKDDNSNSPATGSEIIVTAIDNTDAAPSVNAFIWACTLTTTPPDKVPNQTSAYSFDVGFKNCIKGDQVSVKVVSPGKVVSSQIFTFNP